jgi:hypothetical protein
MKMDPDAQDAHNQWYSVVTGRGVSVSGRMLESKSEELAKRMS